MRKWSPQIESELISIIKDWLRSQGKTQKDLRQGLNSESERMPALLNSLKKDFNTGGMPAIVSKLASIEQDWKSPSTSKTDAEKASDPYGQLDLLLEEIKED